MKKLKIDEQFCIGCNVCVDLCPKLFTSTDMVPIVVDVDVTDNECATSAIEICPEEAISFVKDQFRCIKGNKKIKEIKNALSLRQTDELAEELFLLIQEKQSVLLSLENINRISKLKIGTSEVDVATAVIIRDNMKEKMDAITDIINNRDCALDIITLQKQRDSIYKEYFILFTSIISNDLNVTLEDKRKG